MTSIQPLTAATAFENGWWMDWCEDPRSGARPQTGGALQVLTTRQSPMKERRLISRRPNFYDLGATAVTVNPDGPDARIHYCSNTSYNCNFSQGTGLIFAPDPDSRNQPDQAPIHLVFSNPVTAVGSYVSGKDQGGNFDTAYTALLWIRLVGRTGWEPPVTASGKLAPAGGAGGTPTAPFVGAISLAADGIAEACFDVALFSNFRFEQVAVAELYGLG